MDHKIEYMKENLISKEDRIIRTRRQILGVPEREKNKIRRKKIS